MNSGKKKKRQFYSDKLFFLSFLLRCKYPIHSVLAKCSFHVNVTEVVLIAKPSFACLMLSVYLNQFMLFETILRIKRNI